MVMRPTGRRRSRLAFGRRRFAHGGGLPVRRSSRAVAGVERRKAFAPTADRAARSPRSPRSSIHGWNRHATYRNCSESDASRRNARLPPRGGQVRLPGAPRRRRPAQHHEPLPFRGGRTGPEGQLTFARFSNRNREALGASRCDISRSSRPITATEIRSYRFRRS